MMSEIKLHGYEKILLEAEKKLISQGAVFMFKDFTKHQETEMKKLKDKITFF